MKKLSLAVILILFLVGCADATTDSQLEPKSTQESAIVTEVPVLEATETDIEGDKTDMQAIESGVPFQLQIGEGKLVGQMSIHFVQVVEDSRCPVDVNCFWEGQVGVELLVELADGRSETIILSSVREPEAKIDGHTIQFMQVEPGPTKSGETIDASSYLIELLVK